MALKAEDYIAMYDDAKRRADNFLNLWQETAEYVYPTEAQITTKSADGQAQTIDVVDTTAIFDAQDMASGLSSTLIPPGQPFFGIECSERAANEDDENKQWLIRLTEAAHEAVFGSNFVMQFDEALKSWCVFGDMSMFSERGKGTTLNFREFPAGSYHYLENDQRIPDTFMEKFEFTARQAKQAWGSQNKLGTAVRMAAEDPSKQNEAFEFVHVCRPREKRNPDSIDALDMAYEDIFIAVQDKEIVWEWGYEEFPYHIGRWSKSAKESRGRGVGVFVLPQVRALNQMKTDLIECANRHNNPPREIGPGVTTPNIDVTPGANNFVSQMGNIKPLEGLNGNFPITMEMVQSERMEIHRAFLIDVFNQLLNLRGDRRTTLEISERLNEGLRRLSQPAGRLIAEVLNPMLTRCALILIRAGVVGPIPPALQGKGIRIEYKSPLVLALKRHQAQAFMQWVTFVGQMESVFPGATDNVDSDRAIRDMGDAFGVRADHKRSIKDRDAIREQRAQMLQAKQAMEVQAHLAQGYKQTTRAPEEGSLAGELMGAGV